MRPLLKIYLLGLILLLGTGLLAQNPANPIQIALLRWYSANIVTQLSPCSSPQGLVFDGAYIWVGCGSGTGGNSLVEYNASDGALVRTVTGITNPYGLVYDGANIWASNSSPSGQVFKVDAATGALLATVSVGATPRGMVFDGTNIWVANYGGGSVTKITASTAAVVGTFSYPPTACSQPLGMAFDGTYVWVVCNSTNDVIGLTSTGSAKFKVSVGAFPTYAAYDGETSQTNGGFLWVSNYSSGNVSKIALGTCNPSTGMCATPTTVSVGSGPYGVVFDGAYVWVANGGDNTVTKISQATSTVVGTYPPAGSGLPLSLPQFVAFDGGNIWISNISGGTVSKF